MNIEQITPLILTYNEAANIGRVLARLTWAKEVIVLDSMSSDNTKAIATAFPNVRFVERAFDTHAMQWQYGHDLVETEWVLSLDADYVLMLEAVDEFKRLQDDEKTSGFEATFRYCIYETELGASLYPPRVVLYRKKAGQYRQDGHTQRLVLEGTHTRLATPIRHDDRKKYEPLVRLPTKICTTRSRKIGHYALETNEPDPKNAMAQSTSHTGHARVLFIGQRSHFSR